MLVIGFVSLSLYAIPVMPDCQGRLYSRFGSQAGCCIPGTRFLMFGSAVLSSFSTQPFLISSAGYGELSVMTMMSRPIEVPCESGSWIFPKNCALSLMSSMYLTLMPVRFVNRSSEGWLFVLLLMSMYSGQFENTRVFASL